MRQRKMRLQSDLTVAQVVQRKLLALIHGLTTSCFLQLLCSMHEDTSRIAYKDLKNLHLVHLPHLSRLLEYPLPTLSLVPEPLPHLQYLSYVR